VRRLVLLLSSLGGCAGALLAASGPVACSDTATSAADVDAAQPADATADGADADAAEATVVPRGARVLGVSVVIGDVDFQKNVQLIRDAGARTTNVTFAWDDVERPYDAGAPVSDDGGTDASTPTQIFNPLVHVTNLVLPDERMGATLTIDALDVGGSRAPAELAALPFDDVELATRYGRVTDYVLDQLPDTEITALFLGSAVDLPLGTDAAKHAAFASFVTRAVAHVHALQPKVKVGFVVSAAGAIAAKELLGPAWAASDVVGITYLPVDAAAQARPTSEVASDLERLLAALPVGKPIVIREAGYPTAPQCGSDPAAQAAFIRATFGAWDRHADRIPVVTFRELDDIGAIEAATLGRRRGRTDAPFLAFLQSLGLRGLVTSKQGLATLNEEARARGF